MFFLSFPLLLLHAETGGFISLGLHLTGLLRESTETAEADRETITKETSRNSVLGADLLTDDEEGANRQAAVVGYFRRIFFKKTLFKKFF